MMGRPRHDSVITSNRQITAAYESSWGRAPSEGGSQGARRPVPAGCAHGPGHEAGLRGLVCIPRRVARAAGRGLAGPGP